MVEIGFKRIAGAKRAKKIKAGKGKAFTCL